VAVSVLVSLKDPSVISKGFRKYEYKEISSTESPESWTISTFIILMEFVELLVRVKEIVWEFPASKDIFSIGKSMIISSSLFLIGEKAAANIMDIVKRLKTRSLENFPCFMKPSPFICVILMYHVLNHFQAGNEIFLIIKRNKSMKSGIIYSYIRI
jgi:FlaA1/EpsC-like NDP-sugar epimerase